jgi:hypothetical protein
LINVYTSRAPLSKLPGVWPGKASDGALPGAFSGTGSAPSQLAMRDDSEEDPKTPHPVWILKKHSSPAEAAEAIPIRKDDDRDHHRHVV